jgi:hypothetical protein
MAKIRYIGALPSTQWQGATFPRGRWVTDHGLADDLVNRLRTNHTFEVAEEPKPAAPRRKAG